MNELHHFQFIGINSQGRRIKGTLIAAAQTEIELHLTRLNLLPLRVSQLRPGRGNRLVFPMHDRCRFYGNLATLMESGIPLLQALRLVQQGMLCERISSGLSGQLPQLLDAVSNGQTLSQAMAHCQRWLPLDHCAVVAAAEQQGHLLDALRELHSDCERQLTLVRQLKSEALYPLALLVVLGAAMAVMLTMVVPSLLQLLQDMGVSLSWHMRLLEWVGQHLAVLGVVGLTTMLLLVLLFRGLPGASKRRRLANRSVLTDIDALLATTFSHVPVVGRWRGLQQRCTFLTHACRNYRIHKDLHQALLSALSVVTQPTLKTALGSLPEQLQQGICLSDAMLCSGLFTAADIQRVQIAEQSQDLGQGLSALRHRATSEFEVYLSQIQHGVPAVLLGVAGTLMVWLVVSVLQPIYSLLSGLPGTPGGVL